MIKYGEPGIITKAFKKMNASFFDWAGFIVILLLILLQPVKMFVSWVSNSFPETDFVNFQLYISFVAFLLVLLRLGKGVMDNGIGYFKELAAVVRANKWYLCIALFMVWMLISTACAGFTRDALLGNADRNEGLVGRFLYVCIMLCALMITDRRKKYKIFNVFAVASTLLCLPGFAQIITGFGEAINMGADHILVTADERLYSVFMHFNHYGYYLTMAVMCLAGLIVYDCRISHRICHWIMFFINVYTLLLNNTMGGILAVTLTCLFMAVIIWIKDRAKGIRMAMIAGAFLICQFTLPTGQEPLYKQYGRLFADMGVIASGDEEHMDEVGTGRGRLWSEALTYISAHPIVGGGEECMVSHYAQLGMVQDRPANEYLQYAAFFGIPGALFYVAALIMLLVNRIKKLKHLGTAVMIAAGCVMGYAISAFFGNTMYYTTVYFFVFLGLTAGSVQEETEEV